MSKNVEYQDLIAFHPGNYVEEIIEELNITQAEFAERLGTSSKTISKIVNGEEKLSNDTANKLAKLTGISLKTWLNLQMNYDLKVLEIENLRQADEQEVAQLIDLSYFKEKDWLAPQKFSQTEKIAALRKLLNVADLTRLVAFNALVSYGNPATLSERAKVTSNVMLELATNAARKVTTTKYKKETLAAMLAAIKALTLANPEHVFSELKKVLLDNGIVLVELSKLSEATLTGALKKYKNGSVLLLVVAANKAPDDFWFSLAHELGHLFYEDYYVSATTIENYQAKERRADAFATDFLSQTKTIQGLLTRTS